MCKNWKNFSISSLLLSIFFVKYGKMVETNEEVHNAAESSGTTNNFEIFEDITKPRKEKCLYRGLKLKNGLRVLLINASESSYSQTAAVSLTIGVGSLNGSLAHLVGELLIRLGSRTYPRDQFLRFINSNTGRPIFPSTDEEKQNFGFVVQADFLSPALERFAHIFFESLILTDESEDILTDTVKRIYSFESLNIFNANNAWRFRQIEKTIGDENHAFNRSTGGDEELFSHFLAEREKSAKKQEPPKTELWEELRTFYSTWYSSSVMSLVVFGKETLEELEQMVVPLFERIENKNSDKLTFPYDQHPWDDDHLRRIIHTVPREHFEQDSDEIVRLVFRTADVLEQYKTAPEVYVIELINQSGPGSLSFTLKERKLCKKLKAQYDVKAGIAFFSITCLVPRDNSIRENEIIELILQYINFLKTKGIEERIFIENQSLRKIQFELSHSDHSEIENYVKSISFAMHNFPLKDVLAYEAVQDEWRPSLITHFLSYLQPIYMNIFIMGSRYWNKMDLQDIKWHKIAYKVENIPDDLLESWSNLGVLPESHLPPANEFIPENFEVRSLNENESRHTHVVYESPVSRIWFSADDDLEVPETHVRFRISSSTANMDPSGLTLSCIFSRLLSLSLKEYSYALKVAAYEWDVEFGNAFVLFDLGGISYDKMTIVLEKIMTKITELDSGSHESGFEELFEEAKTRCTDKVKKISRKHFTNHDVVSHLTLMLTDAAQSWSANDYNAAAKVITLKDWRKFVSKMLSHVFIQGLILSNCTEQKAREIAKTIEAQLIPDVNLLPQEMSHFSPRIMLMNGARHFVDIVPINRKGESHLHFTYYQFGIETVRNNIMTSLLHRIIQKKCRNILMEGVLARCEVLKMHGVLGLSFWSLTNRPPVHLDTQFENCLSEVHVTLLTMQDVVFEAQKKVLEDKKRKESAPELYWNEILNGRYFSHSSGEHIEEIKALTREDVITFFEAVLNESTSSTRRKISVFFIPKNFDRKTLNYIKWITKIKDVMAFKNHSVLLPLANSSIQTNLE